MKSFIYLSFIYLSLLIFCIPFSGLAQSELEINADIRSRLQFRNGYRQLRPDGEDPVALIFQRNRLNVSYKYKNIVETFFSVQDIRIWGEQGQFEDTPNAGLFQAWGEIALSPKWKVKVGRQGIVFDDGYLFGLRTWREGGLAHDALNFKFKDTTAKFEAQVVLALNQSQASNTPTAFTSNLYKNLQVLWLKKSLGKSDLAFIFANRALQRLSDTANVYTQTFGPTLNLRLGAFKLNGFFYYQIGKDNNNLDRRAYTWTAKLTYTPNTKWQSTLGIDVLSGTDLFDQNDANFAQNRTFDNLYAYRHRYWGHMDYFYVGFNPSVGLQNLMLKNQWKINDKLTANLDFHSFYTHADLLDPSSPANQNITINKHLGTEVDFVLKYQPYSFVTFRGGYAQMFGTRSLEVLNVRGSNGDRNNLNNWIWLELRFTPKLFKTTFDN